jgi:hypothetical protein
MRVAAGGALVAVKRRAGNRLAKVRTSLYITLYNPSTILEWFTLMLLEREITVPIFGLKGSNPEIFFVILLCPRLRLG